MKFVVRCPLCKAPWATHSERCEPMKRLDGSQEPPLAAMVKVAATE